MLSATTTLNETDLGSAAGHVRAALERAGIVDIFLIKSSDGFCARGLRGRSLLAALAVCTPLAFTGLFSRSGVEIRCRRSLDEGDESLRLTARVRALREFDDHEEVDWVTRGPGELLGDLLQSRRILRKIMVSLTRPTGAGPESLEAAHAANGDSAARRARFEQRYRRAKLRRRLQLASTSLAVVVAVALRVWLDGR